MNPYQRLKRKLENVDKRFKMLDSQLDRIVQLSLDAVKDKKLSAIGYMQIVEQVQVIKQHLNKGVSNEV